MLLIQRPPRAFLFPIMQHNELISFTFAGLCYIAYYNYFKSIKAFDANLFCFLSLSCQFHLKSPSWLSILLSFIQWLIHLCSLAPQICRFIIVINCMEKNEYSYLCSCSTNQDQRYFMIILKHTDYCRLHCYKIFKALPR